MKKFVSILSLLLLVSCFDSEKDPEVVLKKYIDDWFSGSLSKTDVLAVTTGVLYHQISQMDEGQFKEFLAQENKQKKKLQINLKTCTETSCHITYTLTYDQKSSDYNSSIEVKKIAELVWVDNSWKIADVSNLKTFLDYKDEVVP